MTLIIPPGFGSAAFVFTSATGTAPFVTTMGITLPTGTQTNVDIANLAFNTYAGAFDALTDNDLTLDHVTLTIGQDGPGGSVDSTEPPNQMGNSGTFGPVAIAVLARKVTSELGRRGRGRMFLPGTNLESGTETDGSLTSGYRTTVQTALDDFFDGLVDVDLNPVLFHSAAPADPTPIEGLAVADLVGVIRGRIR